MIIEHCEQRSPEWFRIKGGVASASDFDKILTPTLKPSGQADAYLNMLTAEWISGTQDSDGFSSYWMDRGTEMEPEARENYAFENNVVIEEVGFCFKDDDRMVGCSPDGLIVLSQGKRGTLYAKGSEIKCPKPNNHLSYVVGGVCPKQYIPQIQGSMWVTGLEAWDFVSYHPHYGVFSVTVEADPKAQSAFDEHIPAFLERVKQMREREDVIRMRELRIAREAAEEESYE